MKQLRPIISFVLAIAFLAVPGSTPHAEETPVMAGTGTKGGLHPEAVIIEVTSLADKGPGTLREAVNWDGPRVIVFSVGGTIDLESDLRLSDPFVTIAGQTAPAPGILLRGEKLRIATHDVVIQHLSIRPRWDRDDIPNNADAISISSCGDCEKPAADILLENISVSWAIDENIGLWGEDVSRVSLRNSIVAEALDDAGHEKGRHSMGLLIGQRIEGVEVVGNLFVSNNHRNPVLSSGASAYIVNNFIYNPGRHAIHMYRGDNKRATIAGNVVEQGPSTDPRMEWLQWQDDLRSSRIAAWDNHCCDGEVNGKGALPIFDQLSPPVISNWKRMAGSDVKSWALRFAGARPGNRQAIDARIIKEVQTGGGHLIDSPEEVGGYLDADVSVEREIKIPVAPFQQAGSLLKTRLEAWLCLSHFEVGGPQTSACAETPGELRQSLAIAE